MLQIEDFVQEQRMRAKELLSQHRDKVEALAQELMRKKVRMLGLRILRVWMHGTSTSQHTDYN
jgi:ATP-dependent Zn protease